MTIQSSLIAVDVFSRKTYKLQREVGDVLPKRRLAQKHQEELAELNSTGKLQKSAEWKMTDYFENREIFSILGIELTEHLTSQELLDEIQKHFQHDEYCKERLRCPRKAIKLLRHTLPLEVQEMLVLDELQVTLNSFIDEELQESFADVVYEIPVKGSKTKIVVYVLIELKTNSDKWTIFQVLKYIVRIWDNALKRAADEKQLESFLFPAVIPIIFHHGLRRFTAATELISLVHTLPGMEKYTVNFKSILLDITPLKDEEMPKDLELRVFFKILQTVFSKDVAERLIKLFCELKPHFDQPEISEEFQRGLFYTYTSAGNLKASGCEEVINFIKKEGDKNMVSALELWGIEKEMKGIAEGEAKGKAVGIAEGEARGETKGEAKGKIEMILKILTKRFQTVPSQIQDNILQMTDLEKLDELADFVLDCQSIDDLKNILK
jgi:predicted transposase YdaD